MTLDGFIHSLTATINPLETASNLAWWNLATTGDPKYAEELKQFNITLCKIYSNAEDYQFLLSQPAHLDSKIERQATLLKHRYAQNQIPAALIEKTVALETEIESNYTNFRPIVHNKTVSNNDLKHILVASTDSLEREHAWEASKEIGAQVEAKVLELVNLRNASAKAMGYDNYYTMRLQLQELDETHLFQLLDDLEKSTAEQWKAYKTRLDTSLSEKYKISINAIKPWHYEDPFFQEAPRQQSDFDAFYKDKDIVEISRYYYRQIGMPIDDVLQRSDLFEREKKNQHAFCSCIDHKQDVRILCNIRDNEYWMCTQLHELGHAVYDKYIDQALPYFLRSPAHVSTTEAIAMLFGRLSKNGEFLRDYCDLEEKTAKEMGTKSRQHAAENLLVFARWTLVMTHFERALYQNTGEDLNKIWWDYVERFQSVSRVPSRNLPDWAAKLHLACAPVYYQNYILGEMTASQITNYIKVNLKADIICSKEVGNYLKERLFALGARLPWNETLEKATDEALNPQYFIEDISLKTHNV